MVALLAVAVMGLLAVLAPKFGVDSRPDFRSRPDRG